MREDLLIGDIFRTAVRAAPEHAAAWRGDDSITYAELEARGNQVAHALRSLGIGHRDRVVAWNDTTLDVMPLFVALAKLGAVFAPMSPLLAPDEAEAMMTAARPSAIFADGERAGAAATIAGRLDVPSGALAGLGAGEASSDVDEPALRGLVDGLISSQRGEHRHEDAVQAR